MFHKNTTLVEHNPCFLSLDFPHYSTQQYHLFIFIKKKRIMMLLMGNLNMGISFRANFMKKVLRLKMMILWININ